MKRSDFNANTCKSSEVYVAEQWVVTSSEVAVLKSICEHHVKVTMEEIASVITPDEFVRLIVERLQYFAEERLFSAFSVGDEKERVHPLSERQKDIFLAKIQHKMANIAMEESMLERSVLFPGVKSGILFRIGKDFLLEANRMRKRASEVV